MSAPETRFDPASARKRGNVDLPKDLWTIQKLREWLPATSEEPMKKSRFAEEQMVAILREADKPGAARVSVTARIWTILQGKLCIRENVPDHGMPRLVRLSVRKRTYKVGRMASNACYEAPTSP